MLRRVADQSQALTGEFFFHRRISHRFGGDPAHPYDTHGSIEANADQLTAEIRGLAATHPKVDIVAHSMGGAVVDAAFRRGLSASDKVATYIATVTKHNPIPALPTDG